MDAAKKLTLKTYRHFMHDSLYRNSIYLMLSTALQAIFGFIFWIFATHLYSSGDVGIATSLVSVTSLIAALGLFGFNTAIIRYLPQSKNRNRDISSASLVVLFAVAIIAGIYLLSITVWSPRLAFLHDSWWIALLFMFSCLVVVSSTLSDSTFIGLRTTKYIVATYSVFGIVKLMGVFAFIQWGKFGPYAAHILGVCIGVIAGITILTIKYKVRFSTHISKDFIKQSSRFATGNYFSALANGLPALVLPILALNYLGSEQAAYYYVAMMIANVLYIIPLATTQSQLAEGANDLSAAHSHLRKAVTIIAGFLIPGMLILIIFGDPILKIFGQNYADGGLTLLRLLAISSIFISINYVLSTILRIQDRMKALSFASITSTIVTFICFFIASGFGLTGIGIAWLVGELTASLLLTCLVIGFLRQAMRTNKAEVNQL